MGFWTPSLPIRRKTERRTETASGQSTGLWLSDLTVRRSYGKYCKKVGGKGKRGPGGCRYSATQSCSLALPIRHTLEHSSSPGTRLSPFPAGPSSPVLPVSSLSALLAAKRSKASQRGTDAAPTKLPASCIALPCPVVLPCLAPLGLTSSWLRRVQLPRRSKTLQRLPKE